ERGRTRGRENRVDAVRRDRARSKHAAMNSRHGATLHVLDGSRPRVPGHGRVEPDGTPVADGAAVAARGRPAADRLRRGNAAAAHEVERRPTRLPRGLPDALPRGPLPRTAGDAE